MKMQLVTLEKAIRTQLCINDGLTMIVSTLELKCGNTELQDGGRVEDTSQHNEGRRQALRCNGQIEMSPM